MKFWNTWWKKLLVITTSVFLLLFLLFMTLVMNPFEGDFSPSVVELLPGSSDIAIYCNAPHGVVQSIGKVSRWSEVQKSTEFQKLAKSDWIEQWQERLQVEDTLEIREDVLKQSGIDIFDPTTWWQYIGREVAFATRQQSGKWETFVCLRSYWRSKLAYGVLPYISSSIPGAELKNLGNYYQLDLGNKEQFFFLRHRDLFLLSDSEDYLKEVLYVLNNAKGSLLDVAPEFNQYAQDEFAGKVAVYATLEKWREQNNLRFTKSAHHLLQRSLPLNLIDSGTAVVSFHPEITIDGAWNLREIAGEDSQNNATQQIENFLPTRTFLHGKMLLGLDEAWQEFQSTSRLMDDIQPFLQVVNKQQNSPDFVSQILRESIQKETFVALSKVDFSREGLQPFDLYPGATAFFPCEDTIGLYNRIEESLQTINQEIIRNQGADGEGFQFYKKSEHKGYPILTIKVPDTSRGPIVPCISHIDSFIIVTTHVGVMKEIIDIQDKMLMNWADQHPTLADWAKLSSVDAPLEISLTSQELTPMLKDMEKLVVSTLAGGNFRQKRYWQKELPQILKYLPTFPFHLRFEGKTVENQYNCQLKLRWMIRK